MRRFRTLAELGCRLEVRQIADIRANEHIIGDVPLPDISINRFFRRVIDLNMVR
jgi:hypothetical protein